MYPDDAIAALDVAMRGIDKIVNEGGRRQDSTRAASEPPTPEL
jgi:hypothetical protein